MNSENVVSFEKMTKLLIITTFLIASVVCMQVYSPKNDIVGTLVNNLMSAKTETWIEQSWKQKWFGDGLWQTRTKYTIDPAAANTSTTYENRKLLLQTTNKTKEKQNPSYSYSETKGFTFNSTVKGQKSHFEAAVGLTLSAAKTVSYTASVNLAPKKTVKVYGSDVRVRQQYTTYKVQPQRGSTKGWINDGSASTSKPLIKKYSGYYLEFTY